MSVSNKKIRFMDVVRLSFNHLFRNKSRTFLTITGVAIGIGAIVFLVSLGIGLQQITTEQITTSEALTTIDLKLPSDSDTKLDQSVIDQVRSQVKNIEEISPSITLTGRITGPDTTTSTIINAFESNKAKVESVSLAEGEIFADNQVVVSQQLLTTLGYESAQDLIGKEVNLEVIVGEDLSDLNKKDIKLTVSGVSTEGEIGATYLSLGSLQSVVGQGEYDAVKIKLKTQNDVKPAQDKLKELGFQVSAISDLIDRINQVFLIVELLLAVIGAIGLFIASLGIINTMTISLLERTHEIGIMKCVGASNKDIRSIFTFESILISVFGSLVGIITGLLVGGFFNFVLAVLMSQTGAEGSLTIAVSPWPFIVAVFVFSILIGWLAGQYPARRASKLSPYEALRYE